MQGPDEYKVGYKNPPLNTRFGAGESANPQGKTAEQRRLEIANAEMATRIRARLLEAVDRTLHKPEVAPEELDVLAVEMIDPNVLKLIKDSEDRGLGAPKAAVDHTSSDGSMTPQVISRTIVDPARDEGS